MNLTENQLDSLSKYFADISKLVFAATVLGFFIPIGLYTVTLPEFVIGTLVTVVFLWFSVRLAR
ncbi:MAG: hypothetical protein AAB699_01660 [Patescibacteria group bacterium]